MRTFHPGGRLPPRPTRLIGRTHEIGEISDLLMGAGGRLVTLTGPPGIGKTRLAVEVAAHAGGQFADGTWFVDLSPIRDPTLVPLLISRELGLQDSPHAPMLGILAQHLKPRQVLLILDNFEQVTEAADQVAELLTGCRALSIIATSRVPLHITWEQEYPVPPLPVPDVSAAVEPEALGDIPSVALFVEQARRVQPDFTLTRDNAQAVAEICVRLDGLPLSIEMAAAAIKALPPQAIVTRLEDRGVELMAPSRDVPARHRTLRAAINWSMDLLSSDEQALFRRLAVFVGGFTPEAARAVCGEDAAVSTVLEGLISLVDKNLLRQTSQPDGRPRFAILESLREFGLEQLSAAGETDSQQKRHADYYLTLARQAKPKLFGPEQKVWLDLLAAEHANFRAALDWALGGGDSNLGAELAGTLAWFWFSRGEFVEARNWLERALAEPGVVRSARLKALVGAALISNFTGDFDQAISIANEAIQLGQELDNHEAVMDMHITLGNVALMRDRLDEARGRFTVGLQIAREVGDQRGMALMLQGLGHAARDRFGSPTGSAPATQISLYEESLARFREVGDISGAANVLGWLGWAVHSQGDHARARAVAEESLHIFRELGNKRGITIALHVLGEIAVAHGAYDEAARYHRESLTLRWELRSKAGIAVSLVALARLAALTGQTERAARLYAVSESFGQSIGYGAPARLFRRPDHERILQSLRAQLGRSFAAQWAAGHALGFEDAVREALAAPAAQQGRRRLRVLSRREQEVAALVARGLSNRDIAATLVISERTAESHVQRILNKLGYRTRTQIAGWAVAQGLFTPSQNP